jgi:polyprenyl-phospho-N-acetylgalactosaminyl synthase
MRTSYFGAGADSYKEKVSVIIPAFNEEATVGDVVLDARRLFPGVIVVDDHSTDGTAIAAKKGGARVVANPHGRGIGVAILQGIKASHRPLIVTIDADGQHSANEIPLVLGPILAGQADFIIGRRAFLPPSEEPVRKTVSCLIGGNLDVGSGFRAFKRDLVKGMMPGDVGICGCGSLVLYAASLGARFAEVPIHTFSRRHGRSKFSRVSKTSMHEEQARFLLKRYSVVSQRQTSETAHQ